MIATIVQLSDLHLGESDNIVARRVNALAAAACASDIICKHYFVVFSGDIANSGSSQEYAAAVRFIEGLSAAIGKHRPAAQVQFVSVPGNHDCYLPTGNSNLRAALVDAIQPTLQTDQPDGAILGSLLEAQNNYR